jgi:hypothetical protein
VGEFRVKREDFKITGKIAGKIGREMNGETGNKKGHA